MRWRWVAVVILGACTSPSFGDVEAHLNAYRYFDAVVVDASFVVASDRMDYALSPEDTVSVSFRGEDVELTARSLAESTYYEAFLDNVSPDQDERMTIHVRSTWRGDATSTVTWPAPVVLDSLPLFASRGAELAFAWSPSGEPEPMSWSMYVSGCVQFNAGPLVDTGTATLPANTFVTQDGRETETCTVGLVIGRVRTGELDAVFAGGEITAAQSIHEEFASTP